jgi:hypothetical protein
MRLCGEGRCRTILPTRGLRRPKIRVLRTRRRLRPRAVPAVERRKAPQLHSRASVHRLSTGTVWSHWDTWPRSSEGFPSWNSLARLPSVEGRIQILSMIASEIQESVRLISESSTSSSEGSEEKTEESSSSDSESNGPSERSRTFSELLSRAYRKDLYLH